jgi:hypothetical protein
MHRSVWARLAVCLFLLSFPVWPQDSATGAIRGSVSDAFSARISGAQATVTNLATGAVRMVAADDQGTFVVQMLPPGDYKVLVQAPGMAAEERTGLHLSLGAVLELHFALAVATAHETITVSGSEPLVETIPSAISTVLEQQAIAELPLNGRRFTDLALLTPGVTQDPRGLTSSSNGDLAFGGIHGFQTSFLVDGADNNNGFFGQARGRYRAPYQFSNEVIQEFRVSSNTYGAELGRSGSAVINVVTKTGSNYTHGTGFYFVRDSTFNAQQPFSLTKPQDRQQQFGATVGGPVRKNRIFYYLAFDQHVFHVPIVVQFVNGKTVVAPTWSINPAKTDYEPPCAFSIGGQACDQDLVFAAAQRLSQIAGNYRAALLGNAALAKLDWTLSPRHHLTVRLNGSRYYGENNVYFDPASPITYYGISSNGEENVATESGTIALTSGLGFHLTSHLRAQLSRDLQQSTTNSNAPLQKIYGMTDGFGRASILPRQTNERRLHLAQTFSFDHRRHSWKFGGDSLLSWTRNFFPMLYGGEYIFDSIKVNQFTLQPPGPMELTPLRAYAHGTPRYYLQNFGNPVSHPDSREFAWFVQDSIRVTDHLAVTLGLRYDLQTFRTDGLVSNPLWPAAGKLPRDTNNFAPRLGFAYSIGNDRPLVFRGGWGMFYPRIPQIYTSAVATNNGVTNAHLFLDNKSDSTLFPLPYPAPLVACPASGAACTIPANLAADLINADKVTREVSAFARNFQTPCVQQASLGVEKEVSHRIALGVNYLYVHGLHLIRARDVNLPPPVAETYPVFDSNDVLLGYYSVDSFVGWNGTCQQAPCLGTLVRPIQQLGAITQFESTGSSLYHGLTISARRRMRNGLFFRLAYTWAHAIDDGQNAVSTALSTMQNSYSPSSERASSATDQRHRFVFSWAAEPQPFHGDHPRLRTLFGNWKWSGIVTFGSGRPVNARVLNDANGDGNPYNDRLPGAGRNSLTGPNYATTDMRLTRKIRVTERLRFELLAESFNLLNRNNLRVNTNDDSFLTSAAQFVNYSVSAGGKRYPAYFRKFDSLLRPQDAYAPRQVQFGLRLAF